MVDISIGEVWAVSFRIGILCFIPVLDGDVRMQRVLGFQLLFVSKALVEVSNVIINL